MTRRGRVRVLGAIGLVVGLCLAACGSSTATPQDQPTTTTTTTTTTVDPALAVACKADRAALQTAEEVYFAQHTYYGTYAQLIAEHFVADPGPEPLHNLTVGPNSSGSAMTYTITGTGNNQCRV